MSTRASRFIFSSDFATTHKVGEITLSVTLPNTRQVPSGQDVKYTASAEIPTTKSASYRVMASSTKFDYSIVGDTFYIAAKQDGYDASVYGCVYRDGDNIVLCVQLPGVYGGNTTWSDLGQTITTKIEFFKDPYEV